MKTQYSLVAKLKWATWPCKYVCTMFFLVKTYPQAVSESYVPYSQVHGSRRFHLWIVEKVFLLYTSLCSIYWWNEASITSESLWAFRNIDSDRKPCTPTMRKLQLQSNNHSYGQLSSRWWCQRKKLSETEKIPSDRGGTTYYH